MAHYKSAAKYALQNDGAKADAHLARGNYYRSLGFGTHELIGSVVVWEHNDGVKRRPATQKERRLLRRLQVNRLLEGDRIYRSGQTGCVYICDDKDAVERDIRSGASCDEILKSGALIIGDLLAVRVAAGNGTRL